MSLGDCLPPEVVILIIFGPLMLGGLAALVASIFFPKAWRRFIEMDEGGF